VLLLLGTCIPTRAPKPDNITAEQIHIIDQTFAALHEEIAAARRPDRGAFVIFVLSLLVPLCAAIWLLRRAERSAIGEGQMLRLLARLGADEPATRQFLQQSLRRSLPPALPGRPASLPPPRSHGPSGRRSGRRRGGRQRHNRSSDS
jgi:hypothetical protein